jgi:hypothetical protein
MGLDIDFSRPLRTPHERRSLVEAVRSAASPEPELDFIEWKGEVDLGAKRWKFEIARQVLGFANRQPEVAARTFGGCAYLLMGVEPGNVCGVVPVDPADLEEVVASCIGPEGPQWDPHYEELDEATVLVVTVEPPRAGDSPYRLQREINLPGDDGGGVHYLSGETFIRRKGQTRRANARELELLDQRLLARGMGAGLLDVHVRLLDEPLIIAPLDLSDSARRQWLASEERFLLSPLQQLEEASPEQKATFIDADERSPDDYRREVERYLATAGESLLDEIRRRALKRGIGALRLEVANNTEHNFTDVAVDLTLDYNGLIAAFDDDDLPEEDVSSFPKRPAMWGRRRRGGLSILRSPSIFQGLPAPYLSGITSPSRGWVDNSASARIRFAATDLRPMHAYTLGPVSILVEKSHAGEELVGTWVATAKNVSGVARGELLFPVAEDPLAPSGLMSQG